MSQPHVQKVKKRKHAAEASAAEPSTKRLKKDKAAKKEKGKARAGSNEFRIVSVSMLVSVPPVFANNLRTGVEEMLDSMLMRYIPALQGVVVAHGNLQFFDSKATIKADCPFANCRIGFDATVWSPQAGMKLVGKISLCSPDHVSLLVHRTFNVSIPRHHIPADHWEFEYGPAENDPEFAAEEAGAEAGAKEQGVENGGRWVNKTTAVKLGGTEGYLQFTVVGLTVANQMLSLIGSIQPDPFSPQHNPSPASATAPSRQPAPSANPATAEPVDAGEEDLSEDEDTFGMLGRLGDEAVARAAQRQADEKGPAKEKKRKRKEDKAQAAGADVEPNSEKKKKKS
ncbi:hypothetical protein OBBRIDRAFT_786051 [Obba rivulosa]|uniref:RPA43 OB domain-containing protein n=1 Tax=Obba rivulosa TaxID=1052685 RepID=A0A8E2ASQ4_9APHY|nr:hypothetical protein OBBRIDRAFT_786051 [Obba rivulosa]